MLSAEEAFEASKKKLEESQSIIDELLELDTRIKAAIEVGQLACYSSPMPLDKAEALAISVEEYGYRAQTINTQMMDNETKKPLAAVAVCWKYKPDFGSRVRQPESV